MGGHMLPGREQWRASHRSIRFTVIAILVVPVVAAVATLAFSGANISNAIAAYNQAARSDPGLARIELADAVGLAAILIAAVFMGWFARRLTRDLSSLETSARQFADQQLPQLVERLRRGEEVDPETELSPPARVKVTEVARAAAALASLQRTALTAAITETRMRSGISQVFVSLARRSQSLLQRQLRMLDDLESKAVAPGALADLFPLDHLSTRMRRHAEGLIILSGAAPGRAWSSPVPVIDVVRGAIAEVEDYQRIAVVTTSDDMVAGSAVADTIHLLAELIENATLFSPSDARVEVKAERVGRDFAFEIEDRGLGLKPEELDAINLRLSSPADFDLADADRLGLFVVGKLAARHRIRVFLRPSPYGGTTSIVLLPSSMIASAVEAPATAQPEEGQVTEPNLEDLQLALPSQPGVLPTRKRALPARPGTAAGQPGTTSYRPGRSDGSPDAGTSRGLPRRVRQANLSPHLRSSSSSGTAAGSHEPEIRSPEQARNLLASLQGGWERGRRAEVRDSEATAGGQETASGGREAPQEEA